MLLLGCVVHLQKTLKICQLNGDLWDIKFNSSKSVLLTLFGNNFKEKLTNLHFGNGDIC